MAEAEVHTNPSPATPGPIPAAPPRRERNESQWALVWREFRRRRLAVAALYVIVLLITISIFAPLLANDRPLMYRGVNRFEYQEAARTLNAVIGNLSRQQSVDADAAEKLTTIRLQIDLMAGSLTPDVAAALREVGTQIEEAVGRLGDDAARTELVALRAEIRERFDGRSVELVSATHWPVFASLSGAEVGFLVLNVLLLTLPLWRWGLRRLVSSEHPNVRNSVTLAVFVGVPVVAGLIGWGLIPQRVDRTNYKAGVLQSADADTSRAPVVYEGVVWPPIPYGLDEDDLGKVHAKPPWWDMVSGGTADNVSHSKNEPAADARPWDAPHWMGADGIGRDVLSRMIWGGRVSLSVGIVAVSIYVTIGIVVGAIAGYFRGTADLLISRLIEIVICFPSFFLILTIVAFVGPSIFNIMVVIGLIGWTGVARLVRGEFLRLSEQEFVLAGRALGYSPARIIFRHVLPNALAPVLVSATFGIAGAILTESALSFLGFGITVPKPSWGGILATGRDAIFRAPWLIYYPGLAIFITITAYNLVGEALRDAADPRLRGR